MADKDTTASTPSSAVPPTADTPAADKSSSITPSTDASATASQLPSEVTENPFDAPGIPASTTPAAQPAAAPTVEATPPETAPPPTSESPAPTPVPTAAAAPTESQEPRQPPTDPQVASLHAMFPDFEDLVLQSVLESVGGDQDRAIDTLLGMSDPEYMSDARPAEPVVSQTELDEQLARRLMLEDEQQQQQQVWNAQQARLQPLRTTPYEPRRQSHPQPYPQQQGQGPPPGQQGQTGEKDTMAEFQEQFSKVAEAGKKTFGNIFSKVKAKMQEFDQQRPGQGSSTQPTWGGSAAPGAQHGHEPYSGQQQQQQPAYYDPNPQMSPPAHSPTQGYDTTPISIGSYSSPPLSPSAATAATTATPPPASPTAAAGSETPRPPATGAGQGAPIDGGKLGLLPKRPVSLLRSQSPPAAGVAGTGVSAVVAQPQRKPSEDEELEYTENPFEDGRK